MLARYGLDRSEVENWMHTHADPWTTSSGMGDMSHPSAPVLLGSTPGIDRALSSTGLGSATSQDTGAGLLVPAPLDRADDNGIRAFAQNVRNVCQEATAFSLR